MTWWVMLLQLVGWLLLTVGACYSAYQAGRRRECGLWETWYDQQQHISAMELKREQERRSVRLTTVQFRRD